MSTVAAQASGNPLPAAHPGVAERQTAVLVAITPAAILVAITFVIPALWAIYTSTTDLSLAGASTEFIGFDNYRRLFDNPDFPKFVRNTLVFVVGVAVIGQTIGGLGLALLLDTARKQGNWLTTPAFAALIAAWVTPPTLAGFIWGGLYHSRLGVLNAGLESVGLPTVDWLGNYPMLSVIVAETWRGIAFAMIIFLGALQVIPTQIYEAARVDGAGPLRGFLDHTLPSIRHVIALVLLMTTITAMGSFLLIYILTNGDPAYQTETISLHAYHVAFTNFEIGLGAAISVIILLISSLLAALYLGLLRRR